MQLVDAAGARLIANITDVTIPADKLIPGAYFLQITYNNKTTKTITAIKR
ncbi:MAG TPA: hypothetical protein VGG71_15440 [Chitinophagaceae bacterium]